MTMHRLWWRLTDGLDYAITMARLTASDWWFGPYPETDADRRGPDVARFKRLAEQGRVSGLLEEDGDATLDQVERRLRRR